MIRYRLVVAAVALATYVPAAAQAQTASPVAPPISADQAALITPAAEASIVLDAQKPTRARINRLSESCRTVRNAGALVIAYRALCRIEGDTFTASLRLPTCKSAERCQARLNRYAAGLAAQATASRTLNNALPSTVPDADCRRAIRVPQATLITIGRLRSASTKLQQAVSSGSNARLANGLKRFYTVDRSALRDHQGRLDRYRASCL